MSGEINDPLWTFDRLGHVVGPSIDPSFVQDPFLPDLAERALWRAVVGQAVADIELAVEVARRGRGADRKTRYERATVISRGSDARAWIGSESNDVGSLRWICSALGLRVQPIRDYIKSVASGD